MENDVIGFVTSYRLNEQFFVQSETGTEASYVSIAPLIETYDKSLTNDPVMWSSCLFLFQTF